MRFNKHIDLNSIKLLQNPIFIIGTPRSGTTLLQALLSTQNGLYSLPETHFFSIITDFIKVDKNDRIECSCLESVFDNIEKWMGLTFPKQVKKNIRKITDENNLNLKDLFEIIVFNYIVEQVTNDKLMQIRWIEKTPSHFNALETIASMYPSAQFVCIIRNPIAVVYSRKNKLPYDKELSVKELAHQWNHMILSVESFQLEYPERLYIIKYEDLAKNVENEIRLLCEFLKVNFAPDPLKKFSVYGSKYILPWEKWKEGVKSHEVKNLNAISLNNICKFDVLKIQRIIGVNMRNYEYEIIHSPAQNIFDWTLNLMASVYYNFFRFAKSLRHINSN